MWYLSCRCNFSQNPSLGQSCLPSSFSISLSPAWPCSGHLNIVIVLIIAVVNL